MVFLHFGFVRRAFEVRTKCGARSLHSEPRSTYILELLLHLLDRRNLFLYAPGNLGKLSNDLQLRNLHDFLQSGCSTHHRLHFRIVRILTRHRLCSLCTTGTSTIISVNLQFSVPLASLAPASNFGNFFHLIKELNMWRFLCFLDRCGLGGTSQFAG